MRGNCALALIAMAIVLCVQSDGNNDFGPRGRGRARGGLTTSGTFSMVANRAGSDELGEFDGEEIEFPGARPSMLAADDITELGPVLGETAKASYYTFPPAVTQTEKAVETCRKLIERKEVREWLQMTTRHDLKEARKKKLGLDKAVDEAVALHSSTQAQWAAEKLRTEEIEWIKKEFIQLVERPNAERLGEIAHEGDQWWAVKKAFKRVKKRMKKAQKDGVFTKIGSKAWINKMRGSQLFRDISKELIGKNPKFREFIKKLSRNKRSAKRRTKHAKDKVAVVKTALDLNRNAKQVMIRKTKELEIELEKSFLAKAFKFSGGWTCSRIERRGTAYGTSCIQTVASRLTMCKAVVKVADVEEQQKGVAAAQRAAAAAKHAAEKAAIRANRAKAAAKRRVAMKSWRGIRAGTPRIQAGPVMDLGEATTSRSKRAKKIMTARSKKAKKTMTTKEPTKSRKAATSSPEGGAKIWAQYLKQVECRSSPETAGASPDGSGSVLLGEEAYSRDQNKVVKQLVTQATKQLVTQATKCKTNLGDMVGSFKRCMNHLNNTDPAAGKCMSETEALRAQVRQLELDLVVANEGRHKRTVDQNSARGKTKTASQHVCKVSKTCDKIDKLLGNSTLKAECLMH